MRASDIAYEQLRAEIIDWILKPGEFLGEIETAERVGVSRTPVREAFARLAADGLVVSADRRIRVAPLSRQDVIELYEIRECLEVSAARLAAKRRDPDRFRVLLDEFRRGPTGAPTNPRRPFFLAGELDEAIDQAAGSRYITAALEDVRGQMARIRRLSSSDAGRLERATEEHMAITAAIFAGDETLAVHATAIHLHNSLTHILETLPWDDSPLNAERIADQA